MPIDRRETIEAAFDAVEELDAGEATAPAAPAPTTEPDLGAEPGTEVAEASPTKPVAEPAPKPADEDAAARPISTDRAPQSWRAAQKAKWDKLEPDIRQEILRRERDTEKVLSDTSQARQIATAFQQVVQPFMGRIQGLGVHPMVAAQELFKADYVLHSGTKSQKAAMVAKIIADYDVDIEALDANLSGAPAANPVQSEVDRLLQERLAPFVEFIKGQTQQQQLTQRQQEEQLSNELKAMGDNPKYSEFESVREEMADIIEISAKRGLYLTLDQAYNRAVAMNPEAHQRVQQTQEQSRKSQAARAAHARAQKALQASSSVSGVPSGAPSETTITNDRRATIAAAFDQLDGR